MAVWNLATIEQEFTEAALNPANWVKALDAAAVATESYGAVLIPMSGGVLPSLPFTESIAGSFEAYIRDGWYQRDERFRGTAVMKRLGVVDDLDILNADAISRHPYYQEFLAPHGLRWFAGVKVACGDEFWCLSIQRTIEQGPFSEAEKRRLADLSSRLSASAAVAQALGAAAASGALEAFEASATGVLLVNRHGRIFRSNRSAERLLVGDVEINKSQLVTRNSAAGALLNAKIGALLQRVDGGLSEPVLLPRNDRRPLLAYAVRFFGATANAFADCQAMIVLIDLDDGPKPPEATLRSVFRLSEAEARLGAQLATGDSLESVAGRLGIAKETSRSQLKSVFAKTGVRRQSELVAVLARLLAVGRPAQKER
jgi:DNA-binding CsgD family transcriptional regulator